MPWPGEGIKESCSQIWAHETKDDTLRLAVIVTLECPVFHYWDRMEEYLNKNTTTNNFRSEYNYLNNFGSKGGAALENSLQKEKYM